jgi:hypothetical protein
MKKRSMVMALTLIAFINAYTQTQETFSYKVSEIPLAPFRRLVIDAGIDVVLLQNDTLKKAFIEGDEKLVADIKLIVSDGVMTVAAAHRISYRGKLQVTIAVNKLSRLDINAAADIASVNTLQSPALSVIVNGNCDIQLTSTGGISFTGSGQHEVAYLRTEKKAGRRIDLFENLSD